MSTTVINNPYQYPMPVKAEDVDTYVDTDGDETPVVLVENSPHSPIIAPNTVVVDAFPPAYDNDNPGISPLVGLVQPIEISDEITMILESLFGQPVADIIKRYPNLTALLVVFIDRCMATGMTVNEVLNLVRASVANFHKTYLFDRIEHDRLLAEYAAETDMDLAKQEQEKQLKSAEEHIAEIAQHSLSAATSIANLFANRLSAEEEAELADLEKNPQVNSRNVASERRSIQETRSRKNSIYADASKDTIATAMEGWRYNIKTTVANEDFDIALAKATKALGEADMRTLIEFIRSLEEDGNKDQSATESDRAENLKKLDEDAGKLISAMGA
jgi:hypothetical protein